MDIQSRLQHNCERLLVSYRENLEDILNLQATLIRDILPSVMDELELPPDATEWAKEWLRDTSSIFRISRRNKFTKSFAMEAIRKALIWRLEHLWPLTSQTPISNVHCLPVGSGDPFGRPILVIKASAFNQDSSTSKTLIIRLCEKLRIHLKHLHDIREGDPPLQYVVLLDLRDAAIQSLNLSLIPWMVREIVPRFPGMLAGVFVLNYSWAHSGMWSVVKRVLPDSALSRVFFPSKVDLVNYFGASALPRDHGGELPPLRHLRDPLHEVGTLPPMSGQLSETESQRAFVPTISPSPPLIASISPTSVLNPFYGYPASSSPGGHTSLPHGRRRKRDLVRTLGLLLWLRWKKHLTALFMATVCIVLIRAFAIRNYISLLRRFVTTA
ncbi:CRAL-TRIO domain-containing protein [Cyathus striatus]|nr:CRAL-TRIO domain-containing protein [Cyathus striatus]